jgi:hypothetical protein
VASVAGQEREDELEAGRELESSRESDPSHGKSLKRVNILGKLPLLGTKASFLKPLHLHHSMGKLNGGYNLLPRRAIPIIRYINPALLVSGGGMYRINLLNIQFSPREAFR